MWPLVATEFTSIIFTTLLGLDFDTWFVIRKDLRTSGGILFFVQTDDSCVLSFFIVSEMQQQSP